MLTDPHQANLAFDLGLASICNYTIELTFKRKPTALEKRKRLNSRRLYAIIWYCTLRLNNCGDCNFVQTICTLVIGRGI